MESKTTVSVWEAAMIILILALASGLAFRVCLIVGNLMLLTKLLQTLL